MILEKLRKILKGKSKNPGTAYSGIKIPDSAAGKKKFHYPHYYRDAVDGTDSWIRGMDKSGKFTLPPKACNDGPHEFVAYVEEKMIHMPVPKGCCGGISLEKRVIYKCRKCGDTYTSLGPKEWGIVVEEHCVYPSGVKVITRLEDIDPDEW